MWWEEIADHAQEQVGEGLVSAEQPRKGVGGKGSADDRLERATKAFPGGNGPSLLEIEPFQTRRAEASLGQA